MGRVSVAAPYTTELVSARRCHGLTFCRLFSRRIRFDVRLMQRVPYEGVSRMTSSIPVRAF